MGDHHWCDPGRPGSLLIILGMTITAIGNIAGVLAAVSSVFKIAAAAGGFQRGLWASPLRGSSWHHRLIAVIGAAHRLLGPSEGKPSVSRRTGSRDSRPYGTGSRRRLPRWGGHQGVLFGIWEGIKSGWVRRGTGSCRNSRGMGFDLDGYRRGYRVETGSPTGSMPHVTWR